MLLGVDHVFFLLALLLPAVLRREHLTWQPLESLRPALWNVLIIVSAFAAAHGVALTLSALGVLRIPEAVTETVIAGSTTLAAANLLVPLFPRRIWWIVFGFSLFHGLGFAGALADLGALDAHLGLSVVGFNLGVEIGLVAIVVVLFPPLFLARRLRLYRKVLLPVAAVGMILVSGVWGDRACLRRRHSDEGAAADGPSEGASVTASPRGPVLLHRMVDEAALRHPDAAAARCEGKTLTYEELARRSNGVARVLLDTGLERRERVAVLVGKSLAVPVAFYGALASGGTLVPIDPRLPIDQVVRILRATGARRLVTQPARRDLVLQALAKCPEVSHVVGLEPEPDGPGRSIPWTTVDEAATDRSPAVNTIDLDPAYILHTSGSTGTPKLILHTHRSAMAFVEWAVAEYSLTGDDKLSNHSPHHTCFATFDYYAAARAGAATVILTPAVMRMPGSLSALLERERVSVWYSVPTALVHLSLRGDLESRDLDAIRWVLFAGETFPEKHLRRVMRQLPAARFSHVYGSTEVNVCACYHLPESGALGDPLPIGRACSTSETLVVDDELQPVRDGVVGELLVRGSTVMSGYWGRPRGQRASPRPGTRHRNLRGRLLQDGGPGSDPRRRQPRVRRPGRLPGQGPRPSRRARRGGERSPFPGTGRRGGGHRGSGRRGKLRASRGGGRRRGPPVVQGDPGRSREGSSALCRSERDHGTPVAATNANRQGRPQRSHVPFLGGRGCRWRLTGIHPSSSRRSSAGSRRSFRPSW